tara:strand:- start:876 stop:1274 length:399 start_codon:yes stop_codon:yes gene_type:complete
LKGDISDKIILKGMRFYGFHGLHDEERKTGQYFLVNLECITNLHKAGVSDNIEDTINYSDIYQKVRRIIEGTPRNLLEAVAEEIADVLISDYPIKNVTIKISKPDLVLKGGYLDSAGIEIVRSGDIDRHENF